MCLCIFNAIVVLTNMVYFSYLFDNIQVLQKRCVIYRFLIIVLMFYIGEDLSFLFPHQVLSCILYDYSLLLMLYLRSSEFSHFLCFFLCFYATLLENIFLSVIENGDCRMTGFIKLLLLILSDILFVL